MKIMVLNLARSTTESALRDHFGSFGVVQYCTLVLDKVTGKSKGFGFVEMPQVDQARAAIKGLHGRDLDGSIVRVKPAEADPQDPVPPDSQRED